MRVISYFVRIIAVDSIAIRKSIAEAPQLSPEESIKKMHVENGFDVKLVASEPLVVAPVAISFDNKGPIWVVEMQDYMPDTSQPNDLFRAIDNCIYNAKSGRRYKKKVIIG